MRNLLRLLFPRRWRPGPCYADLRAAAERHYGPLDGRPDALCERCAGQQATRQAWWRWVYALSGEHRCARCGQVFAVRRYDDWPTTGAPFDEYHCDGHMRRAGP